MARYKVVKDTEVLLGFEDEPITDKFSTQIGYWTNKLGGYPNWPVEGSPSPTCSLCALPQLLVVQIYAPLHDSPYHRTLYVFCCINPNCWNHSQSWTCRRSQLIDSTEVVAPIASNQSEWCTGSNDWDDDDNGNTVPVVNNTATDSDDSSSLSTALGNLCVDQCNANWNVGKGSGAIGKTTASAEIEGDEGEAVSIDTPTAPEIDLLGMLEATAPLPSLNAGTTVAFKPSFIWVSNECDIDQPSEHVRGLLADYQTRHGDVCQRLPSSTNRSQADDDEKYERAVPAHGDAMFHEFMMRLQTNPGQILRYCRGSSPLLMAPLETPKSCPNCRSDLVFEFQLLPTLLTKLALPDDKETHTEFGNVVIFTCEKSCWETSDKYRDEFVCVQAETPMVRKQ